MNDHSRISMSLISRDKHKEYQLDMEDLDDSILAAEKRGFQVRGRI